METVRSSRKTIANLARSLKTRKAKLAAAIVAIALCLSFYVFTRAPKRAEINLPEIVTRKSVVKTLPLEISVPATLVANEEVLARSRIDGQVKQIHFKEGDRVVKGEPLFTIDTDLLRAQLAQAKANVAKDAAQLDQAKKNLARNKILLSKKIVAKEAIDQYEAAVKMAKGTLDADKAQVNWLELQIGYAQIKAPVTGLTGFIQVKTGNFIRQASDTTLVSIMAIEPIEAIFEIPEKYLPMVLKEGIENLKIKIFDVNGKPIANKNKPYALDQGVNAKAGVFSLKISIENDDARLRPGMSITGRVKLGEFENATTVPIEALLSAQDGSYVFVYDAKSETVVRRHVDTLDTVGNDVIVKTGLTPGQTVVTEGQVRLKNGVKVQVTK